jgi:threonine aldolase
MPPVDLRSDTVTKPSLAMRRALADAVVGDDVYGEDPTVIELQNAVAELLGTQAALFVPTGTMANQIALHVHCRPGDDVLVGQGAHNQNFESGAAGALAGVQLTALPGDGRFGAAEVAAGFRADNHHVAPTRLVCIENTHNMGGGLVWEQTTVAEVLATAKSLHLATHLDGARLWNAACATGRSPRELAHGFDTVSVCLSKGLGAPAGSLLCGPADLLHRAHRIRKMLGGGMRQAGVLAAAGLYALANHRERLADDHANARYLATALAEVPGLSVDRERVHTNIVMVDVAADRCTAQELSRRARGRGVLFSPLGAQRVRLVTHLDVDREACGRAAAAIREVLSS